MNNSEKIQSAIKAKKIIDISYKYGLGETIQVRLHPYIYGDDIFQYTFVWGFLPDNMVYYKFLLDNIVSIAIKSENFEIQKDVSYTHAMEESHYSTVDEAYTENFIVYRSNCPKC